MIQKRNNSPVFFSTDLGDLFKGDCLEVLPTLEAGSFDCIFADPPFNLNKSYGEGVDDNLSDQDYLNWCMKWIDECLRVLKKGGAFYIYNLPKWNFHLAAYLAKKGLVFKNWIAINSTFSLPIPNRLYPAHYSLIYFVKGERPNIFNPPRLPIELCRHCHRELKDYGGYKNKMNPLGINLSDVWNDISVIRHKKNKNRGANELNPKLIDRVLDISTKEGDLVLDPFGGSGTTYIVSELKKRRWLGVEISTVEAIQQRFENSEQDKIYFKKISTEKNVLFTHDALCKREKSGLNQDMYSRDIQPHKTLKS